MLVFRPGHCRKALMNKSFHPPALLYLALPILGAAALGRGPAQAEVEAGDLVRVKEDFSNDPGWEGVRNRIVAQDPPHVQQDFGWSRGKVGGVVWQSRTPAWYGMPLPKALSWDDAFSFCCTLEFPSVD